MDFLDDEIGSVLRRLPSEFTENLEEELEDGEQDSFSPLSSVANALLSEKAMDSLGEWREIVEALDDLLERVVPKEVDGFPSLITNTASLISDMRECNSKVDALRRSLLGSRQSLTGRAADVRQLHSDRRLHYHMTRVLTNIDKVRRGPDEDDEGRRAKETRNYCKVVARVREVDKEVHKKELRHIRALNEVRTRTRDLLSTLPVEISEDLWNTIACADQFGTLESNDPRSFLNSEDEIDEGGDSEQVGQEEDLGTVDSNGEMALKIPPLNEGISSDDYSEAAFLPEVFLASPHQYARFVRFTMGALRMHSWDALCRARQTIVERWEGRVREEIAIAATGGAFSEVWSSLSQCLPSRVRRVSMAVEVVNRLMSSPDAPKKKRPERWTARHWDPTDVNRVRFCSYLQEWNLLAKHLFVTKQNAIQMERVLVYAYVQCLRKWRQDHVEARYKLHYDNRATSSSTTPTSDHNPDKSDVPKMPSESSAAESNKAGGLLEVDQVWKDWRRVVAAEYRRLEPSLRAYIDANDVEKFYEKEGLEMPQQREKDTAHHIPEDVWRKFLDGYFRTLVERSGPSALRWNPWLCTSGALCVALETQLFEWVSGSLCTDPQFVLLIRDSLSAAWNRVFQQPTVAGKQKLTDFAASGDSDELMQEEKGKLCMIIKFVDNVLEEAKQTSQLLSPGATLRVFSSDVASTGVPFRFEASALYSRLEEPKVDTPATAYTDVSMVTPARSDLLSTFAPQSAHRRTPSLTMLAKTATPIGRTMSLTNPPSVVSSVTRDNPRDANVSASATPSRRLGFTTPAKTPIRSQPTSKNTGIVAYRDELKPLMDMYAPWCQWATSLHDEVHRDSHMFSNDRAVSFRATEDSSRSRRQHDNDADRLPLEYGLNRLLKTVLIPVLVLETQTWLESLLGPAMAARHRPNCNDGSVSPRAVSRKTLFVKSSSFFAGTNTHNYSASTAWASVEMDARKKPGTLVPVQSTVSIIKHCDTYFLAGIENVPAYRNLFGCILLWTLDRYRGACEDYIQSLVSSSYADEILKRYKDDVDSEYEAIRSALSGEVAIDMLFPSAKRPAFTEEANGCGGSVFLRSVDDYVDSMAHVSHKKLLKEGHEIPGLAHMAASMRVLADHIDERYLSTLYPADSIGSSPDKFRLGVDGERRPSQTFDRDSGADVAKDLQSLSGSTENVDVVGADPVVTERISSALRFVQKEFSRLSVVCLQAIRIEVRMRAFYYMSQMFSSLSGPALLRNSSVSSGLSSPPISPRSRGDDDDDASNPSESADRGMLAGLASPQSPVSSYWLIDEPTEPDAWVLRFNRDINQVEEMINLCKNAIGSSTPAFTKNGILRMHRNVFAIQHNLSNLGLVTSLSSPLRDVGNAVAPTVGPIPSATELPGYDIGTDGRSAHANAASNAPENMQSKLDAVLKPHPKYASLDRVRQFYDTIGMDDRAILQDLTERGPQFSLGELSAALKCKTDANRAETIVERVKAFYLRK